MYHILIGIVLFLVLAIHCTLESLEPCEETLVLTHVLFRHGNRTADKDHELYPKDPYLDEPYHPYGNGQLTKAGKYKEFSIGKSLRERYYNFLGDYYYSDVLEAQSTDYNRTKMSLQLVLAGLFPPREEDLFDNALRWQPVPFNYLPKGQDKVLLGVLCPKYLEMYEDVSRSEEILQTFAKHSEIFNYISAHTGLNVSRFLHVYNLYFGLSTEEEWGFNLPEWTKPVWPETITDLAIQDYFISMHTQPMKQMATGYFLEKVIEDTKKKILSIISNNVPGKKLYLYSAHENNLAELLIGLGLFDQPHVPNYGAWISLEVHLINDVYGIKTFYQNYKGEEPQLLSIPGCDIFCPLDNFIAITEHLIPQEDLCGI